ncbi:molecular chaperone DjiA, partial [Tamlana sp. PT2-4]|nr:molecular chaperone DjiA [Tamlana laminarinivorans]
MSFSKWIGASIGWSFGGPVGAIIGLALGSVIDAMANGKENPIIGERQTRGQGRATYRTQPRQRPQTQSGDFEVSLLILASVIIKAD